MQGIAFISCTNVPVGTQSFANHPENTSETHWRLVPSVSLITESTLVRLIKSNERKQSPVVIGQAGLVWSVAVEWEGVRFKRL